MHSKISFESNVQIEAAHSVEGEPAATPTAKILAYTGGGLRVPGYKQSIYVDLAGVEASQKDIPIYRNHDGDRIVGHGRPRIEAGSIVVDGVLSGLDQEVEQVSALAKKGFPWQASIGYQPTSVEKVEANKSAKVNGAEVKGPAYIARSGYLYEVSIVATGADRNSEAAIAASQQVGGGDPMSLGEVAATPVEASSVAAVDEVFASIKAERERQNAIAAVAKRSIEAGGDLEVIEKLTQQAIEGKHSVTQFELAVLRDGLRYNGAPAVHASRSSADEGRVIEAALCQSVGGIDIAKSYPEPVLEAAHKRFPHGIKLGEMLRISARRNGYRGESSHPTREFLRMAFAPVQASGASAYDISGILGNVANKSIMVGFMSVESTWREIAAIGRVSDFKTHTKYSLTGSMEYEKVGNDGELKHGTAGEQSYTNKADTYGKMFAITRTDLINDDLGALQNVRTRLGRGAAIAFNKVFWTEFLSNHTSFWTTGRANYFEGSTTVLGVDSLTVAEKMFLDQTDPDGNPMGLAPRKLLVPNALSSPATVLMSSNEVRDTTSSTKYATQNPHVGKFDVVRSSYLANSAMGGGYSTTAWYLLADPMDMATIEVVFLNGVETPTVESADADFDTLGIQLRGYHDFGCNQQEYRAGVKSKGAS